MISVRGAGPAAEVPPNHERRSPDSATLIAGEEPLPGFSRARSRRKRTGSPPMPSGDRGASTPSSFTGGLGSARGQIGRLPTPVARGRPGAPGSGCPTPPRTSSTQRRRRRAGRDRIQSGLVATPRALLDQRRNRSGRGASPMRDHESQRGPTAESLSWWLRGTHNLGVHPAGKPHLRQGSGL